MPACKWCRASGKDCTDLAACRDRIHARLEARRRAFKSVIQDWMGEANVAQSKLRIAERRLRRVEKERNELRKGTYSEMSVYCPACGVGGKGSDLRMDDKRDFVYLSCRHCTEEVCVPTWMLMDKVSEEEKQLSNYRGALESFAGSSDLGRIFPVLKHIALSALKLYPYNEHKPGCPIITPERVPSKHATYCTCSQDSPSKEKP